jgi:hypothetical protein
MPMKLQFRFELRVGNVAGMQALRRDLAPPSWVPGGEPLRVEWRNWLRWRLRRGHRDRAAAPGAPGDFSAAGALPALTRPDLSATSLRGGIPRSLRAVPRLEFLDLSTSLVSRSGGRGSATSSLAAMAKEKAW